MAEARSDANRHKKWWAKATSGALATALGAASLTVAAVAIDVTPVFAASGLVCDGSTVYVQNTNGEVRSFDINTKTLSASAVVAGQRANGLGISENGQEIFTIDNTELNRSKNVRHYNVVGETQVRDVALNGANAMSYGLRGTVNPVTGIYYYTGSPSAGKVYIGAYDPVTGASFQVGNLTGMSGDNGDMAFTATGVLVVVADANVYTVEAANVPTVAGTSDIATELATTLPSRTQGNGVAYGGNGHLFISTSDSILEFNLQDGNAVGPAVPTRGFSPTDMSSCYFPGQALPNEPATVVVTHVDEDGDEVSPGTSFTKPWGDEYSTAPEDPKDWILINTPDNATGTVPENGGTVTYVYAPAGTVVVEFVDGEGNELAPSDELGKKRVGTSYDSAAADVSGYRLVSTPVNASGAYANGETVVTYVYEPIPSAGDVVVKFVDEDGDPVAPSVTSTEPIGDDYTTTPVDPEGWVLIETPENATGTVVEEPTEVTYVYAPAGTVVVEFVDGEGNELAPSDASKNRVGAEYESAPVTVPGYVLVESPANAEGEYIAGAVTVTYVYAPTGTIVVEYVDEDGNPIDEPNTIIEPVGDDYGTEPVDPEDWILVETPENASGVITKEGGTVTYVYAPAGVVVIEHVDENGKPLLGADTSKGRVGDGYTSAPAPISGHILVKTPANVSGEYRNGVTTVTYVYAVAGNVTVEYVDEKGNPLADPTSSTGAVGTDYATTAKKIDGYTLTKVPTNASGQYDPNGTTVSYVYEKVAAVGNAEGELAITGLSTGPMVGAGLAALALLGGVVMLLIGRRRA